MTRGEEVTIQSIYPRSSNTQHSIPIPIGHNILEIDKR